MLARTEFKSLEESSGELANLLRLNNNIAVLCDGDQTDEDESLKDRVKRIEDEVAKIPNSFLWVTEAKEIENYIPGEVWAKIYDKTNKKLGDPKDAPDPEPTDKFPTSPNDNTSYIYRVFGRRSFKKCDFAIEAAQHLTTNNLANQSELAGKIGELVKQIRKWNA